MYFQINALHVDLKLLKIIIMLQKKLMQLEGAVMRDLDAKRYQLKN